MTDIYDEGSEKEQQERDSVLAQRRAQQLAHEARIKIVGTAQDCHDCGESISAERQKAVKGCTRCTSCEQADEARRKLMR